jgi:hypothetical protein
MESVRPRVFVSYSSKDRALIHAFTADMRTAHLEPWLDEWEIMTGHSIREKIFADGFAHCDLFFSYLTPNSLASHWCKEELDGAFVDSLKKRGVAVALFVDSQDTRDRLRPDVQALNCPILEPTNSWKALCQLSAAAWAAVQSTGRLVPPKNRILSGLNLYERSEYRRSHLLERVRNELVLAGPNLRSWLSDPEDRERLVDLLKRKPWITITFVLGTFGILRELGDEGEAHLRASVRELQEMRQSLSEVEQPRLRCHFHPGAATLSAVFLDPKHDDGMLFFTPRWGNDYQPHRRLTCIVQRAAEPEFYEVIYQSLFLMTQPNVPGLKAMLSEISQEGRAPSKGDLQ